VEFEEYFRERRIALFRFAVMLTGNPALADELVSDVLGKAFERWAQVAAADNVHAYVRRMVVNEYLGWRRRHARTTPVADLTTLADPARDHGDAYGDQQELLAELNQLPAKQRAAVVLRYYEGLSFAEIATELGSGENAVRSNISRALARLRIAMTDSPADSARLQEDDPMEACR
jgi:RNA polymerase sigma-70 factor (sigma-E family)